MSKLELANDELVDGAANSRVRIIEISDEGWGDIDLLALLPPDRPNFVWLHANQELVGWGEAARLDVSGPERFSRAQRWLQDLSKALLRDQAASEGLIAFASFAFDPQYESSVIVVPEVTLVRRGSQTWVVLVENGLQEFGTPEQRATHLAKAKIESKTAADTKPVSVVWQPDTEAKAEWSKQVLEAVNRIEMGQLDKVVLARAATAHASGPIDPRWCLHRLRELYPSCWVFKVDQLMGATPELLVSRAGTAVSSRVLAGTIHSQDRPTANDAKLAAILMESAKDLAEHQYAVNSVATALANHCTDLLVPKRPSVLTLGNISHLSTEITGQLADDASALVLSASLHPTAAVCGTPTERARNLITELEDLDRGRYAGPVGWVSTSGDGEFGLALRCAEIVGAEVTAFAGCGLVSGSHPEQEWQESEAKLGAIREVFAN